MMFKRLPSASKRCNLRWRAVKTAPFSELVAKVRQDPGEVLQDVPPLVVLEYREVLGRIDGQNRLLCLATKWRCTFAGNAAANAACELCGSPQPAAVKPERSRPHDMADRPCKRRFVAALRRTWACQLQEVLSL